MMYTDDGLWMRTSENAPVHLQSSPYHRSNNLWINDTTSKQYSPTPFNISSTYSSSSSPVPDPMFLTDNIPNTSVIFDNHYDTYFNNTENVHAPYQCMWNKTDDYSMYTFG
ncbi:ETS translocation variant 4 [Schistosoma japonicum]|uniref:ETS translocation variant 4 n=1 Tax=Schistosoma japonicum TaxID=6182 RepID=A0A4Z2D8K5_SCHJA|nr:ETS translocation variant 4 [Schistosoma japonicum]